ncbi:MAG TPA: response regulator, partial [Polyangiaceae bacterium]|nr:response regulator [Polyangiaceae bacterium]
MKPTILLVEDNPITRKLVRFTLESHGLAVIEAPDGATALEAFPRHTIALVLQDLVLPDISGFELVSSLRSLPRGTEVPILAFSGMLTSRDEARISSAGFDDLIPKPVEPSRLLQIIRTHLPALDDRPTEPFGRGRVLVVADDDPVQRKLVGFRMQRLGFKVILAVDGQDAIEQLRSAHADAVLSDVLMPRLDGFALCMEIRRDPELASVPIVLTTNSYVEPTDRDLARKAGAHDLVLRTPELREVTVALRSSLDAGLRSISPVPAPPEVAGEHAARIMRQLEKQVALNARANQRCALLSAEMSVLSGISEALASQEDIDDALRHALAACFDAGGISLGALYLQEDDVPLRVVTFGFSSPWTEDQLLSFFGRRDILDATMKS